MIVNLYKVVFAVFVFSYVASIYADQNDLVVTRETCYNVMVGCAVAALLLLLGNVFAWLEARGVFDS